jgi:hypothetical protein
VPRPGETALDADLRRKIQHGIDNRMSMKATERHFQLGGNTVSRACTRLKIAYPVHIMIPTHSDADLRRMIQHGIDNRMSMGATERHFQLGGSTVSRACTRLKIAYPVHKPGPSKGVTVADSLTQTAIREMRDRMFLVEAATALGISTFILENRFQELCPGEHWTPKWPNGSKVVVMKNETRIELQERVDDTNRLRATLESRLDDVRTPTPPGTCSMPASVTRPRCAPAGRGHLPVGSGWQVRECWDDGLTVAETVLMLNIQGLTVGKFRSWVASRAEIIIWRHRLLCQDMRRGLDWTKDHNE